MKRQSLLTLLLVLAATAAFAGLHTRSGTVYVQNGQYDEAVRELKLAIEEDPNDAKAHFMIGVAYSNLDMKGKQLIDSVATVQLAYEHFTKAKELDKKKAYDCDNNIQSNYARHYKSGQVDFNMNPSNYVGAAKEFRLATLASPEQSGAHYNLAVTYSRLALNDTTYYEKTLTEADQVLKLTEPSDPNYMRALQLAANTLVYLHRPDEAVERMRKTIEEDPSKYQVVEDMGNDLMTRQRWEGAAAFLKLAADGRSKVSADDATVLRNIGVCEFKMGKTDPAHLDEAIAYYQKSLDVGGDDPDTVFDMMAAYITKPDWDNAALWGEKYVSLAPADAKGWQLLARCYGELGDDAKATEALNRYQQLKDNN
ncbi:MAG TPA: tetratricopeptide repeat protein [Candidatus Krumholzibacteria bacterium]|nr:tetratricopeptide repeat protein [Candidatus Krumholzibacteria bacterium]